MSSFDKFTGSAPIKVVQVGCGGMAQGWVDRIVKKQGLQLVGLVDIRREAAEQTAKKFNLSPEVVFNSLTDAIAKARPDAVVDITIPAAHHGVTLEALRAGCHVLGEKPLSDTLPHAREMCKLADEKKRLYMVTQNRRYLGNIQAFAQSVKDGLIGKLSSLDADFFIGAHFGGFRDAMDNVLIVDMAIHTFDQARLISGADPVSVYCHEFNPHGSWYKGNAAAICIYEMSGGIVFTYRGSWAAAGFNTSWESSWRAIGVKGSILWDGATDPKAQVEEGDQGFVRPVKDVPIPSLPVELNGHEGVLDDFIQCLKTGRTPQTVCHDNIKSLAMCLSAVESAKTGKKVKVEW
jgi:predicted dehydrogenase